MPRLFVQVDVDKVNRMLADRLQAKKSREFDTADRYAAPTLPTSTCSRGLHAQPALAELHRHPVLGSLLDETSSGTQFTREHAYLCIF